VELEKGGYIIDPRKVKCEGQNLTIIYMDWDSNKCYQMKVLDMNHVDTPIECYEVSTLAPAFGIYNEAGEELWPSDCAGLARRLDNNTKGIYNKNIVIPTPELEQVTSTRRVKSKGDRRGKKV